jgi:hypothetical protein
MGGREAEEEGTGGFGVEIGAGKVQEGHGVLGDSNPDGGGSVLLFWKGRAPEVEERKGGRENGAWARAGGGRREEVGVLWALLGRPGKARRECGSSREKKRRGFAAGLGPRKKEGEVVWAAPVGPERKGERAGLGLSGGRQKMWAQF